MQDQSCESDTDQVETPNKVTIDVIADPVGAGIAWRLDIKSVGHGKGNKIDLPKDNNYEMNFTLIDNTKLNLRFDASAPIFVREGGAGPCPTDISTPQIMVDSCNAKTLVVIDWNSGAELELYYQLNFVNKTGRTEYPYDPIIKNGGGGVPPFVRD